MKLYFVVLGALLLIFFSPFAVNDSSAVLPVPAEGKLFLIPEGALFFDLTSSEPVKMFTLIEFFPDQLFVGQYGIKIEAKLFLDDHSTVCRVICRNLWNSSDPPHQMSTSDSFHNTYTYSYSQPTVDDSDFSIRLELEAETEITTQNPVKGWFKLDVVHDGATDKPPDFTMPTPVDATTTTTTTTKETSIDTSKTTTPETTDSNSKQEVSFANSFFCFLSLGVLFLLKKKFR